MKTKKIPFKKVGRKNQHEVTLFSLGWKPFDIGAARTEQSLAEEMLTHYHTTALEYLKIKGFEDAAGYFKVINNKVVKCDENEKGLHCMSLWGAIEERDKANGGQSGEFLAAIIDNKCRMLLNNWPPAHNHCSAIFNEAMLIQHLFFDLYLLETIQLQYSAGKSRTNEAHAERNLRSRFGEEARKIYQEYRMQNRSKEDCYKQTACKLKTLHHGEKTPSQHTIKGWFK